jgi:hypothetical protein
MKYQENPYNGSPDKAEKVLCSTRKMPLITKRLIQNSHNIAHEQKLRGIKYGENPYSESPDKPEQVHHLKVSALNY